MDKVALGQDFLPFLVFSCQFRGNVVAQLVKALCYRPEGGGFDSRWWYSDFFIDLILSDAAWRCGQLSL
jgi:hypothetical protein